MKMENTFGNSFVSTPKHFAYVKKELGVVSGMGFDRFCILSNDCCPTSEELIPFQKIISSNWKVLGIESESTAPPSTDVPVDG